jgi:AcrR family transcriptional regulator
MKKEFEDVSVQEIADEATLNRATFYLHYADQNVLLQAMTESRFRNLIERRAITFTDCNGALRAIALGVCDYLAESSGCPTQLSRSSGGPSQLTLPWYQIAKWHLRASESEIIENDMAQALAIAATKFVNSF